MNFPPDREQTRGGRELQRARERVSEQGGEGLIYCDCSVQGDKTRKGGNRGQEKADLLQHVRHVNKYPVCYITSTSGVHVGI